MQTHAPGTARSSLTIWALQLQRPNGQGGSWLCLSLLAAWTAAAAPAVPITSLVFHPDGAELVSNGSRGVDVRSTEDGSIQAHLPCGLARITALACSPGGEVLAVAGGVPGVSGEVRVFDWRTRTERQRFTNAVDLATSVAFNAEGTLLAVGAGDHRTRVWRRAGTGEPFAESFTLIGHAGPVLAVAFSPASRLLVTGSADRSIKVWSMEDGQLVRTFGHHLEAVNALAFRPRLAETSPTAVGFCASASDDRTVRVWQPEIGRMVRIIRQHRAPVLAVAYAPDGRSLYAAGKEGVIRCFEADSDRMLTEWPAHQDWVYALACSPDGTKLASGDWTGKVQVREVAPRPRK